MNLIPYLDIAAVEKGIEQACAGVEAERARRMQLARQGNPYCKPEEIQCRYERDLKELNGLYDLKCSAKCGSCQADFDYYEQFVSALRCGSPDLARRLTEPPPRCLTCETVDWNKHEAVRLESERLKKEEQHRARTRQQHEDRMAQFFHQNPLADHYVNITGIPPCPAEFEAVTKWQLCDDNGEVVSLGLVLVGGSFLGKTTSLYKLLHRLADEGEDCMCLNSETLNKIPDWTREGRLDDFMQEWKTVGVLAIDDLDKCRLTPTAANAIYALVEARFRQYELPMFITCNTARKSEFIDLFKTKNEPDSKLLGESIYNRIRQRCQFVIFKASQ